MTDLDIDGIDMDGIDIEYSENNSSSTFTSTFEKRRR